MLKHFKWQKEESEKNGTIGIKIENDRIEIFQVYGPAIEYEGFFALLDGVMSPDQIQRAEELHASRTDAWCTKTYTGMNGCKTAVLYTSSDPTRGIHKKRATIHVSMYEKMNEDVSMWLGDLPPLIVEIRRNLCGYLYKYLFEEVEIKSADWAWNFPPYHSNIYLKRALINDI